jgi:hypothetical protein
MTRGLRPPRSQAPAPAGVLPRPRVRPGLVGPRRGASRVRKVPASLFPGLCPAADLQLPRALHRGRGIRTAQSGSHAGGCDSVVAGGPWLPRETRQAMCGLGVHGGLQSEWNVDGWIVDPTRPGKGLRLLSQPEQGELEDVSL